MHDDGGDFPQYVSVSERRARAQRELAQLRKQGRQVSPVVIEGRLLATTFWGKAWCEHLESFSDFESRLPRGRSYARNGLILDLQLQKGEVRALVSGTEVYECTVTIRPLAQAHWKKLVKECSGKIDSVVELLAGKLSSGVMQVFSGKEKGVFPSSKEIDLACSCPDGASLCKHLAAVLYGVGARLDHAPELLFVLRGVDTLDLVGAAGQGVGRARKKSPKNVLTDEDLGAIFGIELTDSAREAIRAEKAPRRNPAAPGKKGSRSVAR